VQAKLTIASLYASHRGHVARWARRLGVAPREIPDVVQDVFLNSLRAAETFRGDSLPSTWLFGVTRNVVGRRRLRARCGQRVMAEYAAGFPPDPVRHDTPEPLVLARDLGRSVERALSALRPQHARVVALVDLAGEEQGDAARELGVNLNSLRVWLHRGRRELRQSVEAHL
jgi:RNA polymerase sigma-70 factor (ECF subfamily)